MYLHSPLVDVFPISKDRDNYFKAARALSEVNLVKWHRNICDKDSFVITKEYKSDQSFEFMIHGYYIKLLAKYKYPDGTVIERNFGIEDGPIYAHIILDMANENYPLLYGSDESRGFTGVQFSSKATLDEAELPDSSATYSLHILDKSGSTYEIPQASLVKFNSVSFEVPTVIDGGEDNI